MGNFQEYFTATRFPSNYRQFFVNNIVAWIVLNIGMIYVYAAIYYLYDINNHESKFIGLTDGKRDFYEYLYLSGMVGTLVGFGDITAKRNRMTKFIIISQVIVSLLANYILLAFKELKLANPPINIS